MGNQSPKPVPLGQSELQRSAAILGPAKSNLSCPRHRQMQLALGSSCALLGTGQSSVCHESSARSVLQRVYYFLILTRRLVRIPSAGLPSPDGGIGGIESTRTARYAHVRPLLVRTGVCRRIGCNWMQLPISDGLLHMNYPVGKILLIEPLMAEPTGGGNISLHTHTATVTDITITRWSRAVDPPRTRLAGCCVDKVFLARKPMAGSSGGWRQIGRGQRALTLGQPKTKKAPSALDANSLGSASCMQANTRTVARLSK